MSLLQVQNLKVYYALRRGALSPRAYVKAVDDVSLEVKPGETVGVVGESGCGKTTLARAVVRLVMPTDGKILFEGEDLGALQGAALRERRKKLQMVFQDPNGSLNPRMTALQIVQEPLEIHRLGSSVAERRAQAGQLLQSVGLDADSGNRYPHEFSGGQKQRLGIARALALEPKLVVCDEPVSALDVSIQAQIVNLLADLQARLGVAYLFIAHDLAVVRHLSRRVVVMYLGRVVESGPSREIIDRPGHPYTQSLVAAVPNRDHAKKRGQTILSGEMPSPINPPPGCPFHPRCPLAQERCKVEAPVLREIASDRHLACHFDPVP